MEPVSMLIVTPTTVVPAAMSVDRIKSVRMAHASVRQARLIATESVWTPVLITTTVALAVAPAHQVNSA